VDIAGMRDKLTHAYFNVDLGIVWRTIKVEIPKFKDQILKILKEMNEN
jgi:uncharacterized protein with HEPN domain